MYLIFYRTDKEKLLRKSEFLCLSDILRQCIFIRNQIKFYELVLYKVLSKSTIGVKQRILKFYVIKIELIYYLVNILFS